MPGTSGSLMSAPVGSISAFFPCYNDEPTIVHMVETVLDVFDELGCDGEVIVVDDGSSDASGKLLEEAADEEPRLRIVTHDINRGYGAALLSGFAAATKEWVFYTDGDAQYDPRELKSFVALVADDVDVVQGYKRHRSDNVARRIIGRIYHYFVSLMFGLHIRDTDCDFRLIRRSVIDDVELGYTTGAICVELVRKLQDRGARFVEAPVHHYPRQYGTSQFFHPRRVLETFRDLGILWVRLVVLRSAQ